MHLLFPSHLFTTLQPQWPLCCHSNMPGALLHTMFTCAALSAQNCLHYIHIAHSLKCCIASDSPCLFKFTFQNLNFHITHSAYFFLIELSLYNMLFNLLILPFVQLPRVNYKLHNGRAFFFIYSLIYIS